MGFKRIRVREKECFPKHAVPIGENEGYFFKCTLRSARPLEKSMSCHRISEKLL